MSTSPTAKSRTLFRQVFLVQQLLPIDGGKRGRESFIHRALVESNRKLIEIFEAKIKARLDEIWGSA